MRSRLPVWIFSTTLTWNQTTIQPANASTCLDIFTNSYMKPDHKPTHQMRLRDRTFSTPLTWNRTTIQPTKCVYVLGYFHQLLHETKPHSNPPNVFTCLDIFNNSYMNPDYNPTHQMRLRAWIFSTTLTWNQTTIQPTNAFTRLDIFNKSYTKPNHNPTNQMRLRAYSFINSYTKPNHSLTHLEETRNPKPVP
jgi:hypothetical protein